MPQAINPFLNKDKETGTPVIQAVNPFQTTTPHGFEFTEEKESGGGIIDTFKSVKDALFKNSEYLHERGILRQVFSKEVLGPSSLIGAGKKLGKDLVNYPAETLEATTRGVYSGAVEPIIETGIRMAIPGEPEIQKKIISAIRKPAELGEVSFITGKKFPETAQAVRQGFEISGIIAPFTVTESLIVRMVPRLPGLITRGVAWVSTGQILHKPEDGSRTQQAISDLALLGMFEVVGAVVRPMFRALKPKTQGTIVNLAAGEKVTIQEAEAAGKEVSERFAMEYKGAETITPEILDKKAVELFIKREGQAAYDSGEIGETLERIGQKAEAYDPVFLKKHPEIKGHDITVYHDPIAGKDFAILDNTSNKIVEIFDKELLKTTSEMDIKGMMDNLMAGRDMVATEEKVVARDLIESYNKQFPNKRFPLEDIPAAARKLDGVENIGAGKIERLQRVKDALAKPFIEGDLQDLRILISELRKEISDIIPKEIRRVGKELSFIATDEQIGALIDGLKLETAE